MILHFLQHLPFEDSAGIRGWSEDHGHVITRTRFFRNEPLPELADFDWLIVLGGSMNIYEESTYPWLSGEKRFIRAAIDAGKTVIGICLGAQLLADVLGGTVVRNKLPEIGWHPVTLTGEGASSGIFSHFPEEFTAFHWHGDTFTIPPGCIHLAKSAACMNQAFATPDGRIIGLQFHLETVQHSIDQLVLNCPDEIVDSPWVQDAETMQSQPGLLAELDSLLKQFLDNLAAI